MDSNGHRHNLVMIARAVEAELMNNVQLAKIYHMPHFYRAFTRGITRGMDKKKECEKNE